MDLGHVVDVAEPVRLVQWMLFGHFLNRPPPQQPSFGPCRATDHEQPSEATANSAPGAGWDMRTDSTPSDAEHGSAALDRVGSSGGDAAGKKAVGSDESAYCICRREGHGEMVRQ